MQSTGNLELEQRIEQVLQAIPGFDSIEVSATEGVVQLSGTTLNSETRAQAVALVERLDGVVFVVDLLEQETQVERTVSPALDKLRDYASSALALLPLVGIGLLIVGAFWLLSGRVAAWEAPYRRLGLNPLLQLFVRQLVRAAIFTIGLLIALDIIGATPFVAAILGTAGVAGLAIGFAFRDIVENYLAGILMSARQPFAKNDLIRIGDHEGKVIRLTTRELFLMTLDGNHIRIPNATVFKSELVNYTRNPLRRFGFEVGIDVEENLNEVQRLGVETLQAMRGVEDEPAPFALIEALGDSNVILRYYGWVDQRQADFLKVRSQAIRLVKKVLDEANVLMPEPITIVRLEQLERATVGTKRLGESRPTEPSQQLAREASSVDITLDRQLDAQIARDEAEHAEPDLLEPQDQDTGLV